MNLDVSRLPREAIWSNGDARINLASIPLMMRPCVDELARAGLIKANESFGFASARAQASPSGWNVQWDMPYDFVWFVAGWGPKADQYIANAVRKLRPTLRTERDTLDLRIRNPEAFLGVVDKQESDGSFKWGDFPYGGGAIVHVGDFFIPCAVSCLREVEDDAEAKNIGGHMGAEMLKVSNPDEFYPPA